MKPSAAQLTVLKRMQSETLLEMVVPLSPFRLLGPRVGAERRYFLELDPDRVPYRVFAALFKRNLIEPLRPSRGDESVTTFVLTDLGKETLSPNTKA